jgi:long-chain acyl-CoA synthetase
MSGLGIAAHARERPGAVAIVDGERRLTYRELHERACRTAHVLQEFGFREGDRLALALPNRSEFFEAGFAAAMLGVEVVPISWRASRDELEYYLEDSGAKLLAAEQPVDGLPVPSLDIRFREEAIADKPTTPPPGALDPVPVYYRAYTSGTTGRPKAVERPRSPVNRYLQAMVGYPLLQGLTDPDEVHLACGPVYHTAPRAFSNYALLLGQTLVLMRHMDAEECLALIERERVTWTHMVPINFVRILALGPTHHDLSSMKRILHAAAPCPVDVKRRVMDVFPPDSVWEYYGMTEGLATMISPQEWLARPGSVGRAAPNLDVHILDGDGRELPPGEVGLVYVTPMGGVRFSYAGAPEKSEQMWHGELYTVGDMGYLDDDGYLFLTDRQQDLIISGGANIYPAEVEAVLFGHPAVADCAVIGVPDAEWGEQVKAIVEPRSPVTAEELVEFCRSNLAHDKCPKTVDFVEKLPRDDNGKIRKRELRDRYWVTTGRNI